VSNELSDSGARNHGECVRLKAGVHAKMTLFLAQKQGFETRGCVFFEFEVKYRFGLKIMFSRERLLKLEFER
jgi:hypothetical protein